MPTLRQTRSLARLVLVWFALFVAAATAGAIARPQQLELICSSEGAVKLQAQNPDGTPATAGYAMDCPLCLMPGAPPPFASVPVMPPLPALVAFQIPASQRLTALALPPLPPRGPPSPLSIE